jgi:hypothetical protein
MTPVLPLILGCLLAQAQDEKSTALKYMRPEGDKFVLESEISVTPRKRGWTYTSTTHRTTEDGELKMTLTIELDAANTIQSAEAVLTTPKETKKATLTLFKDHARLKRGGTTEVFNRVPADPIVTTAPDWSDIIQLMKRYDAKKGGKQEFGGIWFHPVDQLLTPTFTIDRTGADKITVNEKEMNLLRHDIRLRSGAYRAWADDEGRIVRIVPLGSGGSPVVLEGYEEATQGLK